MTGYVLKLIAIFAMLIDHTGHVLVDPNNDFGKYLLVRGIGRLAFPIFCFMIVEGYIHTKSTMKYFFRLLLFAFISEIPFDLVMKGSAIDYSAQNVFFTLAIGLLTIHIINWCYEEKYKTKDDQDIWLRLLYGGIIFVVTFLMGAFAQFIHCDYGYKGIWLISILYVFKSDKFKQMVAGTVVIVLTTVASVYDTHINGSATGIKSFVTNLSDTINNAGNRFVDMGLDCTHTQSSFLVWIQFFAIFGLVITLFYNGKRGPNAKYIFYLFYPLHLLFLVLIKLIIN